MVRMRSPVRIRVAAPKRRETHSGCSSLLFLELLPSDSDRLREPFGRSGIRSAYPAAERVELARKRQGVGIFARCNATPSRISTNTRVARHPLGCPFLVAFGVATTPSDRLRLHINCRDSAGRASPTVRERHQLSQRSFSRVFVDRYFARILFFVNRTVWDAGPYNFTGMKPRCLGCDERCFSVGEAFRLPSPPVASLPCPATRVIVFFPQILYHL